MRIFRKLSIRGKIISVILLMISLLAALSASSIYFLSEANDRLSHVVDVEAEKMRLAARVRADLLEVHRAQKNLILSFSPELTDEIAAVKRKESAELLADLASLNKLMDQSERASIRQFQTFLQEFLEIDRKIESLVVKKQQPMNVAGSELDVLHADAVALSTGDGRSAYIRASELMEDIVKRMDASLEDHRAENHEYFDLALTMMLALCALAIGGGLAVGLTSARTIISNLGAVVGVTDAIAEGNLNTPISVDATDETGRLASSVKKMQAALLSAATESEERDWVKTGIARINDAMQGRVDLRDLCGNAIGEIATYLEAQVGAVFLVEENESGGHILQFAGGYAYSHSNDFPDRFQVGEGLPGQAFASKSVLTVREVPADYLKIRSGLGDSKPLSITVAPLIFENRAQGVVELGFFGTPTAIQMKYLDQVLSAVAINIETTRGRQELADALDRSRLLAEELQQQKDELKASNDELEEQTLRLKESEDKLKKQQEELETVNAELEEKNEYLSRQKRRIEKSNRDLEQTRMEIEEKAEQLAMASKYKSEFLANMSHELRTPLNSILLLGGMLAKNKDQNLTEEQAHSAEIIVSSGNDLLNLINDVLDLAKIEAGRMDLHMEPIDIRDIADWIDLRFRHMAEEKDLDLEIRVSEACPALLHSDRKRLEQILRNLISNAIKFTENGRITVAMDAEAGEADISAGLNKSNAVEISVQDTGIGIQPDKQKVVFEAFQQLDTGAARKYAGTGLGLSISRELAHLMGGDIRLESKPGKGSTFLLLLPDKATDSGVLFENGGSRQNEAPKRRPAPKPAPAIPQTHGSKPVVAHGIVDDREDLKESEAALLVIEDDLNFAEQLIKLCRQKDFKVLFAPTGEEGIELAKAHRPKGIFLDIRLPGKDGTAVLETLKEDSLTRHIPVHVLSIEDAAIEMLNKGAVGFLNKPVREDELEDALQRLKYVFDREIKELLVVEDDENLRRSVIRLIGSTDVSSDEAGTAREAIAALTSKRYDCMILDLGLPDTNGLEMLRKLETETDVVLPPVIVYTGRELTREEETELRRYSESIIIKGVRSEERLLDEASLFLHRMVEKMPERKRRLITNLHDTDVLFRDKKVLLVDDDMRNVFALSKILEDKGVRVLKAENGQKALELVDAHADIDLVLMDMMMPVMDGYETMGRIRTQQRLEKLPIIALTAKAMKQDRNRCIEAGASDYLTKPVDMERLFSMMRVWMYR